MALPARNRSKLLARYGSEEAVERAAREHDIEGFREALGASERRAVEAIAEVLGTFSPHFLSSERASELHGAVLAALARHAHTRYARDRLRLMLPLADPEAALRSIERCLRAKERVSGLPREKVEPLLGRLGELRSPQIKFSGERVLLVESEPDHERILKTDIPRYCRTCSASDPSGIEDAEVVVYVTSEGRLDISRLENVVTVPSGARDHELVPEMVLDLFTQNLELLRTVGELRGLLGLPSECSRVILALERLRARGVALAGIERAVMRVRDEMNAELASHARELNLSGDEVLEVLGQGVPKKVREVYSRVLSSGRARLRELTGCDLSPYVMRYPIEIDGPELERARRRISAERGTSLFEEKVRAARSLREVGPAVEREVREALEFDLEHALGAFAIDNDLRAPRFGDRWDLRGCAHLSLVHQPGLQRVDYSFGGRDRAVLLTGANSGGKTTLLETVAQVAVMARCGLPVCAETAVMDLPERLYFFAQQGSLNAGAFESFLRTLVPAVAGRGKRLLLADELEAMTELEAGARIVAAVLERLKETESSCIFVTHLAREIAAHARVRIDGIEARGLDAGYNLMVDRTPRKGLLARSTPELILRRLAETSEGEEKEVFRELLEKLRD